MQFIKALKCVQNFTDLSARALFCPKMLQVVHRTCMGFEEFTVVISTMVQTKEVGWHVQIRRNSKYASRTFRVKGQAQERVPLRNIIRATLLGYDKKRVTAGAGPVSIWWLMSRRA